MSGAAKVITKPFKKILQENKRFKEGVLKEVLRQPKKALKSLSPSVPDIPLPPELDPTPAPLAASGPAGPAATEVEQGKRRVRRKAGKGRGGNILAGRLLASRSGNILNTTLG